MTGALHDLQLQLSPPLPSSLASVKLANPGPPGKYPLKRRRKEGERERDVKQPAIHDSVGKMVPERQTILVHRFCFSKR